MLAVFGGHWITLPKGEKDAEVSGVALIVVDPAGSAIVGSLEDMAVGVW